MMDFDKEAHELWQRLDRPNILPQHETEIPDALRKAYRAGQQAGPRKALFDAIKQGDQNHQDWLREAIDSHFAGRPVPEPRGKANSEKRIADLEAEIERLKELLMTEAASWAMKEHDALEQVEAAEARVKELEDFVKGLEGR